MAKKSKFEILTYQNYLTMIKASRGSQMFRHLYILNQGQKKDILKNGQLSCGYYVSSILKAFDLISEMHATVEGTVEDMLKNDWRPTQKFKPGNVLVWEEKRYANDKLHKHLGFFLGKNKAISHRHEWKMPVIHHYTYGQKRKIIQIYTHKIIK